MSDSVMNTIMNYFINVINTLSHLNISDTFYEIFDYQFIYPLILTLITVSVLYISNLLDNSEDDSTTVVEEIIPTEVENNVQNRIELENIGRILKTKYSKQEEIVKIYRDLIEKLLEERRNLNNGNQTFLNKCDEMLDDYKCCLTQYDDNIKIVLEKSKDLVNDIDVINQTYDNTFIKDKKYVDENIKRINFLISEKKTLENINNNLKQQCTKYSDDNEEIKKKEYENTTIFLYRKKNSGTKVHTKPDCIFLKNQIERIYTICRKDLDYYVDNECVCAHCYGDFVNRYINLYSIKTNIANSKNVVHLSHECQHLRDKEVKKSVYDYSNYLLMSDFDLICTTCKNTKTNNFTDEFIT